MAWAVPYAFFLAHCLFCSIVNDGWLWEVELKICQCFERIFVVVELIENPIHVVVVKKTWQVVVLFESFVVSSYVAVHPGSCKKSVAILAEELLHVEVKTSIKDVLIIFVKFVWSSWEEPSETFEWDVNG